MTADRISTGLGSFDELLGGGIPPGSVVTIVTPPESPIGLLLAELVTSDDLDTVTYLTTDRHPGAIHRQLGSGAPDATDAEAFPVQLDLVNARAEPVRAFRQMVDELLSRAESEAITDIVAPDAVQDHEAASPAGEGDGRSSQADSAAQATAGGGATSRDRPGATATEGAETVVATVVDSLTGVLSAPAEEEDNHLDALAAWAREENGIAYLVLRLPPARAPSAAESRVLYRADVVIEYRRGEDGGDDQLAVPKFRGGDHPSDPVTLEVTDQLGVNPDRRV